MCDSGPRSRTNSIHFEARWPFVAAARAPSVTFEIARRVPHIGADMSSKILPIALLAVLGAAAYGCQGGNAPGGGIGDPNNGASGGQTPEQVLASAKCAKPAPGAAPLRRLSNAEYRNTVQDLP